MAEVGILIKEIEIAEILVGIVVFSFIYGQFVSFKLF